MYCQLRPLMIGRRISSKGDKSLLEEGALSYGNSVKSKSEIT